MKRLLLFIALLAGSTGMAFSQETAAQSTAPAANAAPAAESPKITADAKAMYAALAQGKVDRKHLSAQLNSALSDANLPTVSAQLAQLGTPTWHFDQAKNTAAGPVQIYTLDYGSVQLHLSFGEHDDGTVWDFLLGK